MSLATRVSDLATRVATEFKTVRAQRATPGSAFWYSGTLNLPAATATKLPLSTTAFNDDAATYGLANGTVTIKRAGIYVLTFFVWFDYNADKAERSIFVQQNGSAIAEVAGLVNSTYLRANGTRVVRCAANDTLELYTFPATVATARGTSSRDTGMTLVRLGD